jgi:hypothetical protein
LAGFQLSLIGRFWVSPKDRLEQAFESTARSPLRTSKFLRGVTSLCCYAGDDTSKLAAYDIQATDWSDLKFTDDFEEIRSTLRLIGNSRYNIMEERNGGVSMPAVRKVLAFICNQLWVLSINGKNTSTADQVFDKAVSGDIINTCRYFTNKYANNCYVSPVCDLIRLAAYVVLAAGEENPYGVGGLEIYVVPHGKLPVALSVSQEEDLAAWFKAATLSIKAELSQPFNYRP